LSAVREKSLGHPYTRALLAALPEKGLHPIPMQVNGNEFMGGCPFSPRCTEALPLCFFKIPEERHTHHENRHIRCHCCHTD
jgi:ABC-type dipeptide/oligopeptide/nickel transport system ATPase component